KVRPAEVDRTTEGARACNGVRDEGGPVRARRDRGSAATPHSGNSAARLARQTTEPFNPLRDGLDLLHHGVDAIGGCTTEGATPRCPLFAGLIDWAEQLIQPVVGIAKIPDELPEHVRCF